MTEGERATDPDVLPGGAFVAYVARVAPGEMALKRLWLDDGTRETLFHLPGRAALPARASPPTACASPSSSRRAPAGTSPSGRRAGWCG